MPNCLTDRWMDRQTDRKCLFYRTLCGTEVGNPVRILWKTYSISCLRVSCQSNKCWVCWYQFLKGVRSPQSQSVQGIQLLKHAFKLSEKVSHGRLYKLVDVNICNIYLWQRTGLSMLCLFWEDLLKKLHLKTRSYILFVQSPFSAYCLISAWKNYSTKGLDFHPCTAISIYYLSRILKIIWYKE